MTRSLASTSVLVLGVLAFASPAEAQDPPPPRVIVTEPAPPPPPPRVVVNPQETTAAASDDTTTLTIQTEQEFELVPQDRFPRRFGILGRLSGIVGAEVGMGGVQAAARVRPRGGPFGLELSIGGFGGNDYNGDARFELPIAFDLMYFFKLGRVRRLELYSLVGAGVSWGTVNRDAAANYASVWVGGEAGIGLEWHVARHFALDFDFRAMVRSRVTSEDPGSEFSRTGSDPLGPPESTNLSWAPSFNFGGVFYF